MSDIELEPRYSTREISGKCLKCLAEQEYGGCLRELLRGEIENKELEDKYEALVSFLKSPDMLKIRDESEKYLADGKSVKIVLHLGEGEPKYEIKLDQKSPARNVTKVDTQSDDNSQL